jgi:hypothetical protein
VEAGIESSARPEGIAAADELQMHEPSPRSYAKFTDMTDRATMMPSNGEDFCDGGHFRLTGSHR